MSRGCCHPGSPNRELALPMLFMHEAAVLGGRARACGGVLGGGQRGRRDAFHARDVALAGSLQALPQSGRDRWQVLTVARGAAVAGAVRRVALAIVADESSPRWHLLHPAGRQPVRAHRRRPVCAARGALDALAAIGGGVGGGRRRSCGMAASRSAASPRPCAAWPAAAARRLHWSPRRLAGGLSRRLNGEELQCSGLVRSDRKDRAVIGGGSGIGEAVASALPGRGRGVVCSRHQPGCRGGGHRPAAADVCDYVAAVDRASRRARSRGRRRHRRLHAGINVRKPILKYSDEELSRRARRQINGNFHVLRAAGRIMTAQRSGSIILFSSIRSHGGRAGPVGLRRDQGGDRAAGEDGAPPSSGRTASA